MFLIILISIYLLSTFLCGYSARTHYKNTSTQPDLEDIVAILFPIFNSIIAIVYLILILSSYTQSLAQSQKVKSLCKKFLLLK